MLLKASQHSEIALIKQRAAVRLHIAGASALFLFGTSVLRHGATCGGDKEIFSHRVLSAKDSSGIVADRSSGVLAGAFAAPSNRI
jgi:hypothetical protein